NVTELKRLEGHSVNYVFNEHVLCIYLADKIFGSLAKENVQFDSNLFIKEETDVFWTDHFLRSLRLSGYKRASNPLSANSPAELFSAMHSLIRELVEEVNQILPRLSFSLDAVESYGGPLCSYSNFLLPVLK